MVLGSGCGRWQAIDVLRVTSDENRDENTHSGLVSIVYELLWHLEQVRTLLQYVSHTASHVQVGLKREFGTGLALGSRRRCVVAE